MLRAIFFLFIIIFFTSRPLDVFSHAGLFYHLKRVQSVLNGLNSKLYQISLPVI